MDYDTVRLAHVIMGEAGICGSLGLLAAAWVFSRNATMYGCASPSAEAMWIAQSWQLWPDPTQGAVFLFSASDMRLKAVKGLTRNKSPTLHIDCAGGYELYAFK